MRLPSNDQWEKASRGVDGRWYPWGHHHVRAYANTQETNAMQIRMLPVQNLPGDVSIYGVQSLAGNSSDWTNEPDPMGLGHPTLRGMRGGNRIVPAYLARCAYRRVTSFYDPVIELSFRLVYGLRK